MNRAIGSRYESVFIELLAKNGWWCHLFAYKPEGQPCDVIALKDNHYLLVDVKHCSQTRFPFQDIRPNQITCFKLARERGNDNNGFAIYFEPIKQWRWLDYDLLVELKERGEKSVSYEQCEFMF